MAKLFGGSKTPAPTPTPAAPMPDAQSPAVLEARRRQQMEMMQRAGRQSTLLSDANRGGDSYSNTKLG